MTDPKDELGARFEDRRADQASDDASDDADIAEETDQTSNTDNIDNSYNTGNPGDTSTTSNMNDTSESGKPGPDPDPESTRNRRQVPMYLSEPKADQLNELYDQLDGQSKVAGHGGIEKHADFMEAIVELATDHEDELAARIGINTE